MDRVGIYVQPGITVLRVRHRQSLVPLVQTIQLLELEIKFSVEPVRKAIIAQIAALYMLHSLAPADITAQAV